MSGADEGRIERGQRLWDDLLERATNGEHPHPQYLGFLVHMFGVRPLSAEADYVGRWLTGVVKRERGKSGYQGTDEPLIRRLVLEFYEHTLRECQADGTARAHLRAEMATARRFKMGGEYIKKLLQQARRERAAQDSK